MLPRESWRPPKYSTTIAPTTQSELTSFRAVKKNGSAEGMRTRRMIVQGFDASDFISSIWFGSTFVRPLAVLMNTGKNTSSTTTA